MENNKIGSTGIQQYLAQVFDTCEARLLYKNKGYSPEGTSFFNNFEKGAAILGCTKEQALLAYMTKHIASVIDMVDSDDKPTMEVVEEKLGDIINYCVLLCGMYKEFWENFTSEPTRIK